MRTLLILIACLLLASCQTDNTKPSEAGLNDVVEKIRYVKDSRTGLCFAVVMGFNGHLSSIPSIATVPCEVMRAGGQ